jgi:hypothetical protein
LHWMISRAWMNVSEMHLPCKKHVWLASINVEDQERPSGRWMTAPQ